MTDFWIAFGSIATAVLAGGTVWLITEGRKARAKEHKAKLLGDIAEWIKNLRTAALADRPFVKNLSEADHKNLETTIDHNRLNRYFSLVVEGEHLISLAMTNKLGGQIVDGLIATMESVRRFFILRSLLFGIKAEDIKQVILDIGTGLSAFIDEAGNLDKSSIQANADKAEIEMVTKRNNLLQEVGSAISHIYS